MSASVWRRWVAVVTLVAAAADAHAQAFVDAGHAAVPYTKAQLAPRKSCESLASFKAKDLTEIQAAQVGKTDMAPDFCRVVGNLAPEIAFEVDLPRHWNGRFYMIGNGGHAGDALDNPMQVGLRNAAMLAGFAVAQTNTGHDAQREPGASFVMSNPQKKIDYAYRAVHLTAVTAKAITQQYYAKPVSHSYWNSCSNGGRQGLQEVQRYPEDFDGVVANAPWVSQTGFTMGAIWNQQAVHGVGLTERKLELLASHVMAKCDALDGLADGLIDDPRKCKFDATADVPACTAGVDADYCLTAAQAAAVNEIYSGPKGVFPGYMLGSEAVTAPAFGRPGAPQSAWWGMIVPVTADARTADFNLAQDTMRYLVFTPPKPDYDPLTFNFERDPPLLEAWSREVDATRADLDRFRARGGKLLMTYGWADQILQPLMGVHYYEQLLARYGARTEDFTRLFMVPGMTHCSGGNGTDQFDPVTAIVDWTEAHRAPSRLRAAHIVDQKEVRSRPLCPYPQVARYTGQGSSDEARNFRCVKAD